MKLFAAIGVGCILLAPSILGEDVVVSGTLGYTAYKSSGVVFYSSDALFTIRTSYPHPTNWNIRMESAHRRTNDIFHALEFYEVGTDGTSVFYYQRIDSEFLNSRFKSKQIPDDKY